MAKHALSKTVISVEHVTIRSPNMFDVVKTKLEALVPRFDDGILALLASGAAEPALRKLEAGPTLSILGIRDHGSLLAMAGLRRRAIQYDIGNPLTASLMTRHQIAAGLYAPIRVLLRESPEGEVAFEYDRPASVFGQFGDDAVNLVARRLDEDLEKILQDAAT